MTPGGSPDDLAQWTDWAMALLDAIDDASDRAAVAAVLAGRVGPRLGVPARDLDRLLLRAAQP